MRALVILTVLAKWDKVKAAIFHLKGLIDKCYVTFQFSFFA